MFKKIFKFMLLVSLVFVILSSVTVEASAPYVTVTVDRYDDMVETQDAYEPILSIKTFEKAGVIETFNSPQDIFIDSFDNFYIVDSNNKRVVILDKDWNYLVDFGTDILLQPKGIFVRNDYIYVADYGSNEDTSTGKIVIYNFDRVNNTVSLYKTYGRPSSTLLEVDNFLYRPKGIAVDSNYTMYIVSEGSSNGILLVNSENRFLNFFAPNSAKRTFLEKVIDFFYGGKDNVLTTKKTAAAPENVMLDDSGYIYTVTKTLVQNGIGDTIKKVNIGGTNFYANDMIVSESFVDSYASNHKTIYAITSNGYIFEYDVEGNLLFRFAGPIATDEQLGLFSTASGIAVDSQDKVYVLDNTSNTIQVFRRTNFTINVHKALELYVSGKYIESKDYWEEVLRYNSMFDVAYVGIGMAYYVNNDYSEAMEQFKIANDRDNYSEAFWEVRNEWLMSNAVYVVLGVVAFIALVIVIAKTNKKKKYLAPLTDSINKFTSKPKVSSILVMTKFIKHPLDAIYYVRYDKRIKIYNALIVMALLFLVYIFHLTCTGFLFNTVVLEQTILLKEVSKIIVPIVLFILANYLISSLMSGEGSFRCISINTLGALMPVIIMLPFIVLISNVLTNNESFLYYFPLAIMCIWTGVLLFVVIKETHNFTVKQTIVNLLLTAFMMVIIVIVVLLLYLVIAQVIGFIVDLVKEGVFRG